MNRKVLGMLVTSIALVGCSVSVGRTSSSHTSQTLIRGNTLEEVVLALGNPVKKEKFEITEGHFVEFLFYPQINEEGTMILAFKEGRLVSWQPSYYEQIKKVLDKKMIEE